MLTLLLPLVSALVAATPVAPAAGEPGIGHPTAQGLERPGVHGEGRAAQVLLAELLGDADGIDRVTAHGHTVTIAVRAHGHGPPPRPTARCRPWTSSTAAPPSTPRPGRCPG